MDGRVGGRRLGALVVSLLACGCGPIAIALGISEALKDDPPPDLINPDISQVAVRLDDGELGETPEYFNTTAFELEVQANKKLRLRARLIRDLLDGTKQEGGWHDYGRTLRSEFDVRSEDLVAELDSGARDLLDGRYCLELEARDTSGRVVVAPMEFVVDKAPPFPPSLLRVDAESTASFELEWVRSFDAPGDSPFTVEAGVTGYRVHYWIAPAYATPPEQVAETAFYPAVGTPLEVSGRDTEEVTLDQLANGRNHRVYVTAVDAAGNESVPSEVFVRRTRIGGEGFFLYKQDVRVTDPVAAKPILDLDAGDFDADGVLDLLVVQPDRLSIQYGKPSSTPRFGTGEFEGEAVLDPPAGTVNPQWARARARRFAGVDGHAGRDDVVAAGAVDGAAAIALWFGQADGSFAAQDPVIRSGTAVADLAVDDVRGAGRLEIWSAQRSAAVQRTDPAGAENASIGAIRDASCLTLADLDGDSALDLVACIGAELRAVRGPDLVANGPKFVIASSGGTSRRVAIGDFDGDVYPDLVFANEEGTISIVLGGGLTEDPTGGGTNSQLRFRAPIVLPVGSGLSQIGVADVDDDTVLDIVVANEGSRALEVFFGNRTDDGLPDGTFTRGEKTPLLRVPTALLLQDFDGDRIVDVAVGDETGNVAIFLGQGATVRGDGTFSAPVDSAVASDVGLRVEGVVDYDGDGIPDYFGIVDETATPRFRVYTGRGFDGQGSGSFEFGSTGLNSKAMDRMVAGDIDRDGRPDFLGLNEEIYTGLGDKRYHRVETNLAEDFGYRVRFGAIGFSFYYEAYRAPDNVAQLPTVRPILRDFNGDGWLDLLTATNGLTSLLLGPLDRLPGPATGTDPFDVSLTAMPLIPTQFASGDDSFGKNPYGGFAFGLAPIEFDASPDLAAGTDDVAAYDWFHKEIQVAERTETVEVISGNGIQGIPPGGFYVTKVFSSSNQDPQMNVALQFAGALDADPAPQIAIYEVATLFLDSMASFATDQQYPADQWDQFAHEITTVEFGLSSVELLRLPANSVQIRDEDSQAPTAQGPFPYPWNWGTLPKTLVIVNRTSASTTTSASDNRATLSRIDFKERRDARISVSFTESPGDHADEMTRALPGGRSTRLLDSADFDGDALTDLVALDPFSRELSVQYRNENTAAPFFDEVVLSLAGFAGRPTFVRAVDVDGDGISDLVVFAPGSGEDEAAVLVFLAEVDAGGAATRTWKRTTVDPMPAGAGGTSVAVGDFNSDGVPDLVVGGSGRTRLLFGRGRLTRDDQPPPAAETQ